MTTDYNKTDGLSPTTINLTGHNSRKTQSPLSLRPPYPPTYTLPTIVYKQHTDCRQAQHTKGQYAYQLQVLPRPHSMQNHTTRQHRESAQTLFFTRKNFIKKIQSKTIYIYIYIYNIVITVVLQMGHTLYIIKIIVSIMNN